MVWGNLENVKWRENSTENAGLEDNCQLTKSDSESEF